MYCWIQKVRFTKGNEKPLSFSSGGWKKRSRSFYQETFRGFKFTSHRHLLPAFLDADTHSNNQALWKLMHRLDFFLENQNWQYRRTSSGRAVKKHYKNIGTLMLQCMHIYKTNCQVLLSVAHWNHFDRQQANTEKTWSPTTWHQVSSKMFTILWHSTNALNVFQVFQPTVVWFFYNEIGNYSACIDSSKILVESYSLFLILQLCNAYW